MTGEPAIRRVLVTGASGFIGHGLIPALVAAGYTVRAATRTLGPLPAGVEAAVIGDLGLSINRSSAFEGVDAVVHGAGLMPASPDLPDEAYERINTRPTAELAKAAARAGVKRFVFLSSVRAQSGPVAPAPLTAETPPMPTDGFGRSKLAAERALAEIDLPSVVLRPVVVHGPGMRFNMAMLLRFAEMPWPLPLARLPGRRSILARDHLIDAILLALQSPAMAGGTFLVADPEPLTIGEMVAAMRRGLGRAPMLLPLPEALLRRAVRLMRRDDLLARIDGSLIADAGPLIAAGWRPRRPSAAALEATVRSLAGARGGPAG